VYNGNVLTIHPANDPNDINWKNLRLNSKEKERLQLNSYFILLLIITLEFIILFGANFVLYNKHSILDLPFTEKPQIFIIVASVIIVLVNSLIKKAVSNFVVNEKHKTRVN
jgi:cytochrome bd-type quinol oxidase subunit 2